jgi:type I restriction enzyme S subunit
MQIQDLCERVTSGGTPSRQRPEFYKNGKFNWFKTKELKDCALYDSEERISHEALNSSSAKLFPPDTVLMAMYGDGVTITSLGILRREAATNQACCAMIPNKEICEPRFLFYSLLNNREDFLRLASGGAQRNLSGSLIRRFAMNTPPFAEQKAIAAVLGALDDKIELNRRMNATLEAIARALFQSWFVDFDPLRAKLDGREPLGLDEATAAIFPKSFHETRLGHIPLGWKAGHLADLCNLKRGHDLPTRSRTAGAIPVISSSGISGTHAETNTRGPGVVTGRYGTIGKVFYVETDYWPLNTTLYVEDFKESPPRFIFHVLGEVNYSNYTDKAAVPGVNRNHLHEEPMVIPPMEVRHAFARIVEPLWSKHSENVLQSRTLVTLRDTLLPKLLSGELAINEN